MKTILTYVTVLFISLAFIFTGCTKTAHINSTKMELEDSLLFELEYIDLDPGTDTVDFGFDYRNDQV